MKQVVNINVTVICEVQGDLSMPRLSLSRPDILCETEAPVVTSSVQDQASVPFQHGYKA